MFPQIFGKYVLEREIGTGGMARVYLATLRGAGGFEKRLVVKQIRAELASDAAFVKRFVEEAKTAVELSHTNIVPVYELGVEQGVYYIAMEFCEGVTLSEVLERGPIDPYEGAYVGVEICRALGYAHRRAGIVHRDVTPRNVLIDDEGAVHLIDFGIAAPVSADGPVEIFGSPGHMPPEQLQGAELSPATDVFAVFALLIEAWSGTPPFRRPSPAESLRALGDPPPALSGPLEPLAEHVARCVALEAARRPESADDAARPLREFLKTADLGDVARRLGERVQRARARRSSVPAPPPEATPSAAAGGGQPETRTFAARDELSVWTRPIESEPEQAPVPVNRAESGPATRRLSQAPGSPQASPGGSKTSRAVRVLLPAALLMALLAGASALRQAPTTVAPPAPLPPRSAPASAPEPAREPEPPPAPARPSAALTSVSPAQSHRPAVSAERSGRLQLTANPQAEVSIDGEGVHQTRTTPVPSLALKPGSYLVTFRNATYGPPVKTTLTVTTGGTRIVHVDFRELKPRLTVR